MQHLTHQQWLVSGWLRWRYDCKCPTYHDFGFIKFYSIGLGSVVVFLATIFALWTGVTNGSTAIVIVQAGIFADASRELVKYARFASNFVLVFIMMSLHVRVLAQLELDFNSVERIVEYLGVPQEAPAVIDKSRPPAYWPSSNGELVIENLVVRYAPDLPDILRGLSCVVKPSEKVGIVSALPPLVHLN